MDWPEEGSPLPEGFFALGLHSLFYDWDVPSISYLPILGKQLLNAPSSRKEERAEEQRNILGDLAASKRWKEFSRS